MKESKGQKRWNRQSGRLAKSNCEGASGQRQRRMPTDHHRIWQWKHHRKTEEFEETPLESILEHAQPEEAQRHPHFWLRGIVPASLTSPPPHRTTRRRETKRHTRQSAVDCWRCVRRSSRGKPKVHEAESKKRHKNSMQKRQADEIKSSSENPCCLTAVVYMQ